MTPCTTDTVAISECVWNELVAKMDRLEVVCTSREVAKAMRKMLDEGMLALSRNVVMYGLFTLRRRTRDAIWSMVSLCCC